MLNQRKTLRAVAMAVTIPLMWGLTAATALASGAVINLGPIQPPSLGWGQTGQFSAYLSQNGKPIPNASVQFWFSGRHGIRTGSWYARTNKEGRATFTQTLPSGWRNADTWADLNASYDQAAAYNYWRVKNK